MTSGFVVETNGRWFVVTADHTFNSAKYEEGIGLDKINKHFEKVSIRLYPLSDPDGYMLPLVYDEGFIISMPILAKWLRDAPGNDPVRVEHLSVLDIAVFELHSHYVNLLKACGVVPLTRSEVYLETEEAFVEEVLNSVESEDLRFYICGVRASEFNYKDEITGKDKSKFRALDVWPKELENGPNLTFNARWDLDVVGRSVKGMSGGPAIAVVKGKPYVFGVQAAETMSKATVTISYAPLVFGVVDAVSRMIASGEWTAGKEA